MEIHPSLLHKKPFKLSRDQVRHNDDAKKYDMSPEHNKQMKRHFAILKDATEYCLEF